MTREEAIALGETKWWVGLDPARIVGFQLFEQKLCMDFGAYHEAVEKVLGRPVYTHEFAYPEQLQREFLGDKPAPTLEQIIELIPAEKRVVVVSR